MSWRREEAEGAILELIQSELVDEPLELGADDDLLGSGLIDSLGVMRLIRFVEQRFGVSVPPVDVTIENFMTVSNLVTYLESLGRADASAAER